MSEREIVTVGLGNYSTLIAAQWANSATRYDQEHETLFTSTSYGPERVPRLVLLDHHHASKIKQEITLDGWDQQQAMEAQQRASSLFGGAAHDAGHRKDGAFSIFANDDEEEDDDVQGDDESDGGDHEDGDEDNDVCQGNRHVDPEAEGAPAAKRTKNFPKIFDLKDHFVPWHQYIRTGLHPRSYTLLPDTHEHVGGNMVLHNAGFGLQALSPESNQVLDDVMDNVRFMLERSDHPQGTQFFVDADGCFVGAAVNLMSAVNDLCGTKASKFCAAAFEPFPTLDLTDDDFARTRLDECILNRALAYHRLAEAASIFTPFHVDNWEAIQRQTGVAHFASPNEVTASAQVIAAAWDTATYGLRLGAGPENSCPEWYMSDMQRVVRPCESMRVASAFAACPLRVHRATDDDEEDCFWTALNRNPLIPAAPIRSADSSSSSAARESQPPPTFMPLTHAVAHGPESDAGRVLGHVLGLRGIASLRDVKYPREEALLRFLLPLRTSTIHTTCTLEAYPISDTFPASVILPSEKTRCAAELGLADVPVGAHFTCTYSAAPMLKTIVESFDQVVKYRRHVHARSYQLEIDDWTETSETLHQMFDDYNHMYSEDGDDETY